ncbi:MAG: PAS domain S-box protein [Bacteroidetes bacterium]|nr:PAS domain S-box protein [Bacteroidota bacterium]
MKISVLKHTTPSRILLSVYAGLFFLLAITGYFVMKEAGDTNAKYNDISGNSTRKLALIGEIRTGVARVEIAVLRGISVNDDLDKVNELKSMNSQYEKNNAKLEDYEKLISDTMEQVLFHDMLLKRNENTKARIALLRMNAGMDHTPVFNHQIEFQNEQFEKFQQTLTQLSDYIILQTASKDRQAKDSVQAAVKHIAFLIAATIFLLMLMGFLIVRAIRKLMLTNSELTDRDEKLQTQKNLFEGLLESAPDGIIGINEKGMIAIFNKQAENIFGYNREEILGELIETLMPERFRKPHEAHTAGYFRSPSNRVMGGSQHELYGKRKNGKEFPIDIGLSYLETSEGKIAISSIRDVTERKKAEQQLRSSEEALQQSNRQLKEISSSIPGAVYQFVIDENKRGKFLFVSEGIKELSGYTPEEIYSDDHKMTEGIPSEDLQLLNQAISESVKTLKPFLVRYRILDRETGNYKWVRSNAVPFVHPNGKTVWNGTLINISDAKLAEEELHRKNSELIKTNEELDRFVYSTSHDLRSPLTSVLGLTDFIESESSEPETIEHARMIKARIQRLDRFILNILNYSRNNRVEVETSFIRFKEIIEATIYHLNYMEGVGKIQFETQIDDSHSFLSDPVRITTVFENLIANAVKFQNFNQPKPVIRIEIKTGPGHAQITVRDNGIGIAPEHQQKIFNMFYRVSGKTPGSGLGLYLVKEIVDKLEGTLDVQSEKGSGTTFSIILKNLQNGK